MKNAMGLLDYKKDKRKIMIKRALYCAVFFVLLSLLGDSTFLQTATVEISASEQTESADARPWFRALKPLRELYISPSGNSDGNSPSKPMSIAKAINSAKPGDLYWLQEGTYRGEFKLSRAGTEKNPIVFRAAGGKRVIIQGGFYITGAYNWIWGLEITDPSGVAPTVGAEMLAPGIRLINNVIHDQYGKVGIGAWQQGAGQVVYGNIIYKQIPKSNNPHNLYIQNDFYKWGYKYVVNNLILDSLDATDETYNVHAYTQGGLITGLWFEDNVIRNGTFLIGGFNLPADREVVKENYFYKSAVQFGYRRPTQVRFQDNYLGRTELITEWFWGAGETQYKQTAPNVYTGNEILNPPQVHIRFSTSAFLSAERCDGCARIRPVDVFDQNKYSAPFRATFYADNKNLGVVGMDAWRRATAEAGKAFDKNSVIVSPPKGAKVVVLRNDYDPSRAHLVVYNWSNTSRVRIDLGGFLSPGSRFAIFDSKQVFQTPFFSGTYSGPIELQMGKEFGAYLITRL